ncbi:efflux RND transporter periplasmic adaptor subunit, partial [candidate division WWE3 bacterium]|nr:efflux RND transporter periplasmic adaptor subunit [candidate division WWE3 bacterium]
VMSEPLRNKRTAVLVLALLLGVAGIVILKNRTKSVKAETYVVARGDLKRYISSPGKTDVGNQLVRFAKVNSTITSLNFKDGDEVNQGDLIVALDKSSFKASSEEKWSSYLAAKSDLETNYTDIIAAEADAKAKKLIRDHTQEKYNEDGTPDNKEELRVSEANYEAALTKLYSLKNKRASLSVAVNSAYSSYISAKNDLGNTLVASPVSGILILEDLTEGGQVKAGQKLFSILNVQTVDFVAEVDETDIREIKDNLKSEVSLHSYPEEKLAGNVKEISSKTFVTDSGSTAVKVKIQLNRQNIAPIIGLNGEARIEIGGKKGVLTIPLNFVSEDQDGSFVWVKEKGKAKKAYVALGLTAEDYQEVVSGLNEGQTILKGEDLTEGVVVNVS